MTKQAPLSSSFVKHNLQPALVVQQPGHLITAKIIISLIIFHIFLEEDIYLIYYFCMNFLVVQSVLLGSYYTLSTLWFKV